MKGFSASEVDAVFGLGHKDQSGATNSKLDISFQWNGNVEKASRV